MKAVSNWNNTILAVDEPNDRHHALPLGQQVLAELIQTL
jgi:hypothetical protein